MQAPFCFLVIMIPRSPRSTRFPSTTHFRSMVGGLHPSLKKEWYLDLLRRVRVLDPELVIKAFTAIEIQIGRPRLNSSHANISYAVFCLKKKKLMTTATSTSHPREHTYNPCS